MTSPSQPPDGAPPEPGDELERLRKLGWRCMFGGIATVSLARVATESSSAFANAVWAILIAAALAMLVVGVRSFRAAERLRRGGPR